LADLNREAMSLPATLAEVSDINVKAVVARRWKTIRITLFL